MHRGKQQAIANASDASIRFRYRRCTIAHIKLHAVDVGRRPRIAAVSHLRHIAQMMRHRLDTVELLLKMLEHIDYRE